MSWNFISVICSVMLDITFSSCSVAESKVVLLKTFRTLLEPYLVMCVCHSGDSLCATHLVGEQLLVHNSGNCTILYMTLINSTAELVNTVCLFCIVKCHSLIEVAVTLFETCVYVCN
jgi:hypothetical protein